MATNDVHFLNEDDFEAHDVLCCIDTGKKRSDPTRLKYPTSVFLKSPEQMRTLFADLGKTVRELCLEKKVVPPDELARLLEPRSQTEP